jgi:hypothetical protein
MRPRMTCQKGSEDERCETCVFWADWLLSSGSTGGL